MATRDSTHSWQLPSRQEQAFLYDNSISFDPVVQQLFDATGEKHKSAFSRYSVCALKPLTNQKH